MTSPQQPPPAQQWQAPPPSPQWQPPNAQTPAAQQPAPKRRKWPWIVGVIAAIIVIASVTGGGGDTQPTEAAGEAPAAAAPADGAQAGPVELTFGESHTWSGGETIAIAAPRPFDDPLAFGETTTRPVALDVTVTNGGDDEYNVMQASFSAQHSGRVAQENLSSDFLPNTVLPPGGSVTFTLVYDIGQDPGELRLSAQPNAFAAETVYFVGQY